MQNLKPALFAALAFALVSGNALALTKAEYDAGKDKIKAEHQANEAQCKTLAGNAKDVCEEEADGKKDVAEAELKAQHEPTPGNQEKARVARADATYEVAKEKCDDLSGDTKNQCVKDAKTAHAEALKSARAKQ